MKYFLKLQQWSSDQWRLFWLFLGEKKMPDGPSRFLFYLSTREKTNNVFSIKKNKIMVLIVSSTEARVTRRL